ncbi:MAG: hypothetical protein IKB07_06280 [Lachnospiraceae bacterium]|nr:hypothetical protein [Lachnospiraceae bacterium]
MNQDSSFPPMLPPSSELGALLFAVLPCLQETYRPLASFAYHMTELTKLKNMPSVPPLTGLSGIDALITDKDIMLRSLSFYGRMFRMPLLSTIATLLQGFQFYQTYKDIFPGILSGLNGTGNDPASAFGSMAGLFSGLGGFGNSNNSEGASPDLFSMLGGLSPDMMSSLFSGFSGGFSSHDTASASPTTEASDRDASSFDTAEDVSRESAPPANGKSAEDIPPEPSVLQDNVPVTGSEDVSVSHDHPESSASDDTIYHTLYSFLTPEQQKIYEQLMHTD